MQLQGGRHRQGVKTSRRYTLPNSAMTSKQVRVRQQLAGVLTSACYLGRGKGIEDVPQVEGDQRAFWRKAVAARQTIHCYIVFVDGHRVCVCDQFQHIISRFQALIKVCNCRAGINRTILSVRV